MFYSAGFDKSYSRPQYKISLLLVLLFITIPLPSFADDSAWYEGFFIEGSALFMFEPDILSDYLDAKPGFRGAVGYEYKNFRFGIESGYINIVGTNPLVKEITLSPLIIKFGYTLPLFSIFGLQADLGIGNVFSKTLHYETAIDVVFNNLKESNENSFISGLRIYFTASPWNFIKIFAGGGVDIIFETDGAIPLPLFEIGLSFKPGKIAVLTRKDIADMPIMINR